MLEEIGKLLGLSLLMSVLIAALFTFGAPVQAQDAQAQDTVNAQNQQNILLQSSTTQGVPLLTGNDDKDTPDGVDAAAPEQE